MPRLPDQVDAAPTGDAAHAQRRGLAAETVREGFDGKGSRAADRGAEGGDRVGEFVLISKRSPDERSDIQGLVLTIPHIARSYGPLAEYPRWYCKPQRRRWK